MKFCRHLEDTLTPEWKKAYIDYRALKKQITAIRQLAQSQHQQELLDEETEIHARSRSATPPLSPHKLTFEEPRDVVQRRMQRTSLRSDPEITSPSAMRTSFLGRGGLNRMSRILPSLKLPQRAKSRLSVLTINSFVRRPEPLCPLPLPEVLANLLPHEALFFKILDEQLDKVEKFYLAREEEMLARGRILQMQLNELNDHRNLVKPSATSSFKSAIKSRLVSNRSPSLDSASLPVETAESTINSFSTFVGVLEFSPQDPVPAVALSPAPGSRRNRHEVVRNSEPRKLKVKPSSLPDADYDSYVSAKRKLKKAVLDLYRGLELLYNYRVVNITGFRKAVKKFEKVTKIRVQDQYMSERVEKTAFASSEAVRRMMKQMEEMYASAFLKGDRKKAETCLRADTAPQTQHFSMFGVGMYLGLAVPALIDVCQRSTWVDIPALGVLIYLYGVLLVPVLFALLVGLNLVAWVSTRINYVFIFELEVLSRIDYRRYFEIPAFLLATLIYAFWLTVSQIGAPPTVLPVAIQSTWWPLIWTMFAVGVLVNPLPVMHRRSRYWLLRNLGKQLLSGLRPVEFTDFWMGDQLCSMTFSLSHLATLVCVYIHRSSHSFPTNLEVTCGTTTKMWGVELVLVILPNVIRLLQSLKRYAGSRMHIHLVNGGKYLTAVISTVIYLYWRRTDDRETIFAMWCLWGVFSSLYSCAWDLFMDWSIFARHNERYPFLRSELVYPNHVYVYYIAIVTNTLARFAWLLYIPREGPKMLMRTFIVAMIEMLRRWQWNFFRLENEHLGNMDQYRVTREVPLPYPNVGRDEDEVEDERNLRATMKMKI